MKNIKSFIIATLSIILVGSVVFIGTKLTTPKEVNTNNILSSPIVMGDSLYTLSKVSVSNSIFSSKYHLIFTGKIPAETAKDLDSMKALATPSPTPFITYSIKGAEHNLKTDEFEFTHVNDDFKLEYIYNKVPKDASRITATLTYKNKAGEDVTFTTPPIELK